MGSPSAAALIQDRLASNALAGCSHSIGAGGSTGAHNNRSRRWQGRRVLKRSAAFVVACQLPYEARPECSGAAFLSPKCLDTKQLKFRRRRLARLHSTLRQADYSVYKELPSEQITEEFLWGRLRPLLHYLSEEDIEKVQEALSLASDAHAGQLRKSGEPFITHPVEVARLLAELHMDKESLIAGLLHDTVEDNPAQITFEEIGVWFGQAVRTIVEGETKFSKIGQLSGNCASSADVKARDLQHLFLAMTKEVRIIVVKLADRLHNMRTLDSMPPHKQKKIAEETLQVFAPLARLLGLYSIKEELEELAFSYSQPERYLELRRRLDQLAAEHESVVNKAKQALEQMLWEDEYLQQRAERVEIVPTQKSVYSVHRKLQEAKLSTDDVADATQLCVVIHLKADQEAFLYGTGSQLCYHVMGLVHTKWAPIPGSIKDYIATPKRNGYQSLHTTVVPLGNTPLFPLEVLIRTSKMQEIAEYGIAGEKWVAKDAQGWDSLDLDPEVEAGPGKQKARPPNVVGGLLRMLPRIVGLSHDLANGSAALSVNGTIRSGLNGKALNGKPVQVSLHPVRPPQKPFTANGTSHPKTEQNGVMTQRNSAVRLDRDVLRRREHWLKSIIEWQKEFVGSLSAREFVDGITDDLLGRGVFVFTPNGDLMRLPKDSTTVDFAYHVHTDVGNQMVGAKVNGKLVNPDHLLSNAEVVEILTYNGPPTSLAVSRHYEWQKFVKSKTARHKLAKFLRDNMRLLPEHQQGPAARLPEEGVSETAAADAENTFWLNVEGVEAPGVLAELARIIAKHGHDVKTYSGSVNSASGTLLMRFEVKGLSGRSEAMCAEIGSAPFVRSWKLDHGAGLEKQPA